MPCYGPSIRLYVTVFEKIITISNTNCRKESQRGKNAHLPWLGRFKAKNIKQARLAIDK